MTEKIIQGVKIFNKKVITDERGKILHMLRNDDENFNKFGEIYFSYVNPNKIKAWHIHKKMTLNYCSAYGNIKLVLFDERKKSKTKGLVQEIFLSNDNHILVSIPPMVWNGFCSADENLAVLANCSDIPHDKEEILRIPFDDPKIPYKWIK
jgi:dTDP-4-dehydrorhamnose 3,5-epimerase|tara:strand:+ start:194 stop:646 length:453 start_codon:yes stop_codon:yes gene_type:complete